MLAIIGTCLAFEASSFAFGGSSPQEVPPVDESRTPAEAPLPVSRSRLSDESIPLQLSKVPGRTAPLIELGDPFLGVGAIAEGLEIPGGAVWNPNLLIYGTLRTAVQGFRNGGDFQSELVTRLDIFGNLALTPTERLLVGFRPLDDEGRDFTGFSFSPDDDVGFEAELDARLTTLFFEGNFGELLPDLDPEGSGWLDFGFAVGRQRLSFQEGMLIDDTLDAVGVTRNNLRPSGVTNLRVTGAYAWNNLHRGNRARDDGGDLFGLFSEADVGGSTLALDMILISAPSDSGDAFFVGASAVQRLGSFNAAFRFNVSIPLDEETAFTRQGYLLFAELSWTPKGTEDLYYLNGFWGIDEFTSAARSPDTGGPLSRTGILYAAQGLGRYGSALSSDPAASLGLAFGRQFLFDENRKQLVFELGGRIDTDGRDAGAIAVGGRYQQAIAENFLLQIDSFGALTENERPGFGVRMELQIKF